MFRIDLLTLAASFGAFQGFLLSVIFWFRKKSLSHRIFSLLLFATSIRLAKNIFIYLGQLNPDYFSWYDFFRLALSHQYAIGPLLFFYFQSRVNRSFRWEKKSLYHFLPYFVSLVISPFLPEDLVLYTLFYFSYISMLIYFASCVRMYLREKKGKEPPEVKGLLFILIVAAMLMLIHSPIFFSIFGLVWGGVFFLLVLIAVMGTMFFARDNGRKSNQKYLTSPMEINQIRDIKMSLVDAMDKGRPYLDPALSLDSVAKMLSVKRHQLSRVINQELGMSFSDYINGRRLAVAVEMLSDHGLSHLKIAAIAYDSGFNSVPSFNAAFKKAYGVTPSQFRKERVKRSV